jgi:3-phosphoshikimate 1-carboxyvinyltransferase
MIQNLSTAASLHGTVFLPGDKSISHRYAMLAAVAEGDSELHNFASSQDCQSTLRCLRALGADVRQSGRAVFISGRGLRGLRCPEAVLDAGNSGTTIRLLSGILAGHPFESTITGDESLSRRPMQRVLEPLRLMGAEVDARPGGLPPLKIAGGVLKGIRYNLPVPSAQVKSCVLLAGLYAGQATCVIEPIPTRDHTEIALEQFGACVRRDGALIEVDPAPRLAAQKLHIPCDLSGAAFFLIAAALVPGSELVLPGVGLNRRRRALIDYLRGAGMALDVEDQTVSAGEPRGTVRVRYEEAFLGRTMPPISGALTAALIDEIPILSVLGAVVRGGLVVSDAAELRVKESDRIAAISRNIRAMGAESVEKPGGLQIPGGQSLRGADIVPGGDHRIAMAFAIAALRAEGETRIHNAECADVSFPGFWDILAGVTERL